MPVTPAVRVLRKEKAVFDEHLYTYEPRGGTAVSARALGVPEEIVVKTLVFEDEKAQPLIVLMNGPDQVSTKNLARHLGKKTIQPCKPEIAQKHTGYQVGGTSPFGTKNRMPVYMEQRIADLETIYINGGKRGFLVSLSPSELVRILDPDLVDAIARVGS